jgi:hypothetical protein
MLVAILPKIRVLSIMGVAVAGTPKMQAAMTLLLLLWWKLRLSRMRRWEKEDLLRTPWCKNYLERKYVFRKYGRGWSVVELKRM